MFHIVLHNLLASPQNHRSATKSKRSAWFNEHYVRSHVVSVSDSRLERSRVTAILKMFIMYFRYWPNQISDPFFSLYHAAILRHGQSI